MVILTRKNVITMNIEKCVPVSSLIWSVPNGNIIMSLPIGSNPE